MTELSRMLVKEEIDENSTVYIDASAMGNELLYRVENNGGIVNAVTGQKSDILIQMPNGPLPRSDAAQAVKKMKIEKLDDDEDGDVGGGPIRSKNELQVFFYLFILDFGFLGFT